MKFYRSAAGDPEDRVTNVRRVRRHYDFIVIGDSGRKILEEKFDQYTYVRLQDNVGHQVGALLVLLWRIGSQKYQVRLNLMIVFPRFVS